MVVDMSTITNPATNQRSPDAVARALENLSVEFTFTIVDRCADRRCAVCADERLSLAA